jgi:Transglycosylase-like domain
MVIVRRVLLLALVATSGIAVLTPLAARSVAELPEAPGDHLLVARGLPGIEASRGGVLSVRGASLQVAARGVEAVTSGASDAPARISMEATLFALPPPPTPAAPSAATYSGDSVWDDLARCESGGNWAINTGNGYYGGLQFSLGTWNGYGGAEFAEYPHQATREQQIVVAERLRAARGYAPWPACRAKLGLP